MYEQYDDATLNAMTRDELVKIPTEFWVQRSINLFQANYDIPLWFCENPDDLPCHGERMEVPNREGDMIRTIIYRPENPENKKLPVYFHIHGGGFNKGYVETNDNELTRYCKELGCYVIAVGYRLSPQCRFPGPLYDCYDIIKWYVDHADEYNLDINKIGIGGESAGANLANAVSLLACELKEFPVKCQMLVMPGCNHHDASGEGELLVYHLTNIIAYVDYDKTDDPHVSPYYMREEDMKIMPPTIMITAELDDLRLAAEPYALRLAQAGVPVTMKRFQGVGHCFALKDTEYWVPDRMEEGLAYHVQQLRRHLLCD